MVENEGEIQREHALNQREMGDILGNGTDGGGGGGKETVLDMV